MQVLWLIPAVILLGGMWFLLRAVIRFQSAMTEVRVNLAELAEMAPRLQGLADDVSQLADSIEEKRHQ